MQTMKMLEEKYQELLALLKQCDISLMKVNKEASRQVDLCSKLYNKAKEDSSDKYYANLFVKEADKLISSFDGKNNTFDFKADMFLKPMDLRSAVDFLEPKKSPNLKPEG